MCFGSETHMNKVKIFSILAILLLVGTATAAIYIGYNHIATVYIDVPEPSEEGVETLASIDGTTYTESVTMDGVTSGDTCIMYFTHENVGDDDYTGNIHYVITCMPQFEFDTNKVILDFTNADGIKIIDTAGNEISANDGTYIYAPYNDDATISTEVNTVFSNSTTLTSQMTLTFNNVAYGSYTVSGEVVSPE